MMLHLNLRSFRCLASPHAHYLEFISWVFFLGYAEWRLGGVHERKSPRMACRAPVLIRTIGGRRDIALSILSNAKATNEQQN